MKKKCVILLMLFVLMGLAGCGFVKVPLLSIEKAEWAVLRDGSGGNPVTVRDAEHLAKIRIMFCGPKYEQGASCEEWSGWSYSLEWYDAAGELLDSIVVNSPSTVQYDGHFQSLSNGEIDTNYLDELLDTMPESTYADRVTRISYTRSEPYTLVFKDDQGNQLEIQDAEIIDKILNNLCELTFAVGEPAEENDKYFMCWAQQSGEMIDSVMLVDDHTIWRSGYNYTAMDGKVDLAYLQKLVEDPPPIHQDTEDAQAILEAAFDVEESNAFSIYGDFNAFLPQEPEALELARELAALDFTAPECYEGSTKVKCMLTWSLQEENGSRVLSNVMLVDEHTIKINGRYFTCQGRINMERIERLWEKGAVD